MGGPTSGWRRFDQKAQIVEDCCVLDLTSEFGDIEIYEGCTGEIDVWHDGWDAGSIGYEIQQGPDTLYLTLTYGIGFFQRQIELPVPLEVTYPNFGGVRWWGRCPLDCGSGPCHRRVAKLYLPLYERYFGCRHCYGLTYRSVQEERTAAERMRRNDRLELIGCLFPNPLGNRP